MSRAGVWEARGAGPHEHPHHPPLAHARHHGRWEARIIAAPSHQRAPAPALDAAAAKGVRAGATPPPAHRVRRCTHGRTHAQSGLRRKLLLIGGSQKEALNSAFRDGVRRAAPHARRLLRCESPCFRSYRAWLLWTLRVGHSLSGCVCVCGGGGRAGAPAPQQQTAAGASGRWRCSDRRGAAGGPRGVLRPPPTPPPQPVRQRRPTPPP